MTTLEIILLVTVIYLIIGIIFNCAKPEDHYLIYDPVYEKIIVLMNIFFWPIMVVRVISEMIDENRDL